MEINKIQTLKYILIFLVVAVAFFSWLSIDRAINNPQSSDWIVPISWFLTFFILINLIAVVIKETYIEKIILAFAFLLSFIFIPVSWHLLAVLCGLLFIFLAFEKINRDLELNIKISLWKTLRTGRAMIVLGLAIMITSQYYLEIRDSNAERLIPKVDVGSGVTGDLTSKALSMINPEFKKMENDDLTVDELLVQFQKKQMEDQSSGSDDAVGMNEAIKRQFGGDIPPEQLESVMNGFSKQFSGDSALEEASRELFLAEGRKRLSDFVGHELKGDEKVSEVFSDVINNKINNYFNPDLGSGKSATLLPTIMAIILFLTIVPLGNILSIAGVAMAMGLFGILRAMKLVVIKKVPTEKEIIE